MVDCTVTFYDCARSCMPPQAESLSDGTFTFAVNHYFGTVVLVANATGYATGGCSVRCDYYEGCEFCEIVLPPLPP
jgi:hypothetical protein